MSDLESYAEAALIKYPAVADRKKTLQPTEIALPSRQDANGFKETINARTGDDGMRYEKLRVPGYHPDPKKRALGFRTNPAICTHMRQRFRTRWICQDCGEDL